MSNRSRPMIPRKNEDLIIAVTSFSENASLTSLPCHVTLAISTTIESERPSDIIKFLTYSAELIRLLILIKYRQEP